MEEILPDYIANINGFQKPKYKVYRQDTDGGRYYVVKYSDGNDVVTVYMPSATTIISKATPTPKVFLDMISSMGKERFDYYTSRRAAHGTVMHILIGELFTKKILPLKDLDNRIYDMLKAQMVMNPIEYVMHVEEMKKDLLAFLAFVRDHYVVPYAIELPLACFQGGYCMAVDMVCKMKIEVEGDFGEVYKSGEKKGQTKLTKEWVDIAAIVDFKSGKKGFYEGHEIQLSMAKVALEQNYGDIQHYFGNMQLRLFNWAPAEWRGNTPTYKLKDQTLSVEPNEMWAIVYRGISRAKKEIPALFEITGDLILGEDPSTMFKYQSIQF